MVNILHYLYVGTDGKKTTTHRRSSYDEARAMFGNFPKEEVYAVFEFEGKNRRLRL